jgi:hypothetical protein
MAPWELHEMYPPLDIKDTLGYPDKLPPKWEKNIPKFDGDPLSAIPHVSSFVKHVSELNERNEDVLIRLFLLSLETKQKD